MKYLLLLLFPLTAFADDSILTWDSFSSADQMLVQEVIIERMRADCPNITAQWVEIGRVPGTQITYTDVNVPFVGAWCYRARSWNSSGAISGPSNLVAKWIVNPPVVVVPSPANLSVQ